MYNGIIFRKSEFPQTSCGINVDGIYFIKDGKNIEYFEDLKICNENTKSILEKYIDSTSPEPLTKENIYRKIDGFHVAAFPAERWGEKESCEECVYFGTHHTDKSYIGTVHEHLYECNNCDLNKEKPPT